MTRREAVKTLKEIYLRGGCVRTADKRRRKAEGDSYKHGYEVRLACRDRKELLCVRSALKTLGLTHGSPYAKARQTVVPVYGRLQVGALCEALGFEDPTD